MAVACSGVIGGPMDGAFVDWTPRTVFVRVGVSASVHAYARHPDGSYHVADVEKHDGQPDVVRLKARHWSHGYFLDQE